MRHDPTASFVHRAFDRIQKLSRLSTTVVVLSALQFLGHFQSQAQTVYFFDDFTGPTLNPLWQASLPTARCGSDDGDIATYAGAPNYAFETLDTNSVLDLSNEMGPLQRLGWSSSTNFVTDDFRYEVRFNTLTQGPNISIDAFIEIWIIDATNSARYDIISPFEGGFGTSPYFFFGSSIDGSYTTPGYQFQDNTWYRLVLQGVAGQNIQASLCDDNDNQLLVTNFRHTAATFGSGFTIALSQTIGNSGVPYPTQVAVDYVNLTSSDSPPVITAQPQSLAITNGGQANFSVTAVPPGNGLSYQWQIGGMNLADGGEISGSLSNLLTLHPISSNDLGNYTVIVTNNFGSVTSHVAALTFATNPPTIISQPQSLTITNQALASFSVTASNLLGYQWQKNGTNMSDGGEISGSITTNLILFPASTSDTAGYTVIVTNSFGSVTSSVATLTVVGLSAITNGLLAYYPFDRYANDASGNGNNGTNNGATFVLDRFNLANEAIYFNNDSVTTGFYPPLGKAARTISGWFDVTPSASQMTLLAYGDPVAAEQIALKINAGGQFDLDLSTYGLSTVGTYNDENWHSFVVIIPTNSLVSGVIVYLDDVLQTNLVLVGPSVQINTVTAHPLILGEYFNSLSPLPLTGALDDVRVYNRALADAEVQLLYQLESSTADAAPILVQQPHNVTLTNGSSTNFSVAISGLAPFAYQWQLGGSNLANGNGISGSTTSNLTLNPASLGLAGSFDVIATNAYGSVTSSVATLTVRTIFAWHALASPQLVNLPITVSVQAENVTNGIATNFAGTVGLSASGGVTISPTNSGAFVNGVWTGKINVPTAATNLVLTATDSLGDVASANAISVVSAPQLGVDTSGDIALLLWPVVAPNTTVLTSTNLATTNWVPLSAQPVQIGNQLVVPLDMSNPHRFYRLRFSEP